MDKGEERRGEGILQMGTKNFFQLNTKTWVVFFVFKELKYDNDWSVSQAQNFRKKEKIMAIPL